MQRKLEEAGIDVEARRKQMREASEAAAPSPEEIAKKEVSGSLQEELSDVGRALQASETQLRLMQRTPGAQTMYEGYQPRQFDPKAIEAQEDAMLRQLGLKRGLEQAFQAFEHGRPIPPESRAALREIQSQAAEQLRTLYEKKQTDPRFEQGYLSAQRRLQSITSLMERLAL